MTAEKGIVAVISNYCILGTAKMSLGRNLYESDGKIAENRCSKIPLVYGLSVQRLENLINDCRNSPATFPSISALSW